MVATGKEQTKHSYDVAVQQKADIIGLQSTFW